MGTSGSGKTYAVKKLDTIYTRLYPNVRHYILDTKIEGDDFANFPGTIISSTCPKKPGPNERYQVWRCPEIIPEEIERWIYGIRKDPPALLIIDELASLTYKPGHHSSEYNLLCKWGRALPVGSISLTQELGKIPSNAYKQSTHRLGFYLEGDYDKRIRNDMLKKKVEQPPDFYGFYYQHKDNRFDPTYFKSIQDMIGE